LLSGPKGKGEADAAKATRIVSANAAVATGVAAGLEDGLGVGLSPQAARSTAVAQDTASRRRAPVEKRATGHSPA
jgi:hypothetical protein